LRTWLEAGGSLTARLRRHGSVRVVVLRQGSQRFWPQEQDDLQHRSGHVREVALLLNGIAAVWARSATPHDAFHGPWKSLADLGNRPLAELLFQGRHIHRSTIVTSAISRHGPVERTLRQAWTQLPGTMSASPLPRWARSSVFWHHGQPLRVLEAFAPWLARLPVV
jgi:chorismate lyase